MHTINTITVINLVIILLLGYFLYYNNTVLYNNIVNIIILSKSQNNELLIKQLVFISCGLENYRNLAQGILWVLRSGHREILRKGLVLFVGPYSARTCVSRHTRNQSSCVFAGINQHRSVSSLCNYAWRELLISCMWFFCSVLSLSRSLIITPKQAPLYHHCQHFSNEGLYAITNTHQRLTNYSRFVSAA